MDKRKENSSKNEEMIEFFNKRFDIIKKQRQEEIEEERQRYKNKVKILEDVKKNPC